ncbi:MAG: diaminopimelate dehydrogenase [Paludibacteraceae bacterium]|nr:diaminopimelate dehydrogenase [Paludibacteraceae bacterium]
MLNIAIIGYGNIGKAALDAVLSAPDMQLAGIVRRNAVNIPAELAAYKVVDNIDKLSHVDVALLCTPTREVPRYAAEMLSKGISTVDSFDIHTQIADLRSTLMPLARQHNAVSIISAGWDPGSDSVVRCLLEAIAPKGITYTNFGPGRSMGHSVAVRAIDGVEDALSVTIPLGTGIHRRMVYVQAKQGYDHALIEKTILEDDYFRHDETHVQFVDNVDALNDTGHGVNLVRKGVSGKTHNQHFEFNMSINNPALTGQVMVACARAAKSLQPGAYTMIEIPPIALLPGSAEDNIRKLV